MNNKLNYKVPQTEILPVASENTVCQSGGQVPEFGDGGLLGDDLKLF